MPALHRNRSRRIAAAVCVVMLAASPLAGCGGSSKSASSTSTGAGKAASGARVSSPRGGRGRNRTGATQRYARFAACMRKHGVSLPAPNTSGKGPIFDSKGFNPRSAAFKVADRKCAHKLFPKRPTGR
jgi:hypothetical protein